MDASASTAVITAITTFGTDAVEQLVLVIPLAVGLLITVALVPKVIKWFRRIARV